MPSLQHNDCSTDARCGDPPRMRSVTAILDFRRIKDQLQIFCTVTSRSAFLNIPSKLACLSFHRAAWLNLECAQLSHPPYPPITSQSFSRDVPVTQARAFRFSPLCPKGSSQTVLNCAHRASDF